MNWETVFKIIGAAVVSAGGVGAIIVFVVKFLSERIAERMLKKYDAKLQKDIEEYKHNLEVETEKYKVKSERLTYVTQRQFDTEFTAYQSIFNSLYDFSVYTGQLFPMIDQLPTDKQEQKEIYKERYKNFCDAFNSFSETLEKNAPFITAENYAMFVELRQKANEIACMFPEIRIFEEHGFEEDNIKLARENYQKTREFHDMVSKAKEQIREYLSTLKVDKE